MKKEKLTMDYFLVDFENVSSDELKKVKNVSGGDSIVLFYSDHCKNIKIETLDVLTGAGVSFTCINVKAGRKDALDFQLSSYLGYLIGNAKEGDAFHIVAKDKGYDCLINFWRKKGKKISKVDPSQQNSAKQKQSKTAAVVKPKPSDKSQTKPETDAKANTPAQEKSASDAKAKVKSKRKSKVDPNDLATLDELREVQISEDSLEEVLVIFNKFKTKQAIVNGLNKKFKDSKRTGDIYQKLKPLFKTKKKK